MIAYTYDLSTSIGRTRLLSGDIDPEGLNRTNGDRTRTDAEVLALLTQSGGDPRMAAAALLEMKAAEYASSAGAVTQGTLRQDFSARSAHMLEAARALRSQPEGVTFLSPTLESGTLEGFGT